jgi:hypothetical protein
VRAFAHLVRGVADPPGQPADAGAAPLVVQRVRVRDVQVGGADVLVVEDDAALRFVVVARVERQVQAHPVPVGEAVAVAVVVGLDVEAERRVVRERAPQIANGENRAEAPQPRPCGGGFIHKTSIPSLLANDRRPAGRSSPRCPPDLRVNMAHDEETLARDAR